MRQPAFWSLALDEITDPDLTHVAVAVLPAHATADPAAWARFLMSRSALPWWLSAPASLRARRRRRQGRPAHCQTVTRTEGDEVLVRFDARLIDARLAVGVDEERSLVRVVTTMRLKGRGALYAAPLRVLVPLTLGSMMVRSRRILSGVTRG